MSEDLQVKFLTFFKQNRYCVVDFVKVNGEVRVMTCSLDPSILPVQEQKESTRKKSHDTLAVYDTTRKDWRAFKVASVRKFSSLNPDTGEEVVLYSKEK